MNGRTRLNLDCKVHIKSFGPPASRTRVSNASAEPALFGVLDDGGIADHAVVLKKRSTCQKGTFHGITANNRPTDS